MAWRLALVVLACTHVSVAFAQQLDNTATCNALVDDCIDGSYTSLLQDSMTHHLAKQSKAKFSPAKFHSAAADANTLPDPAADARLVWVGDKEDAIRKKPSCVELENKDTHFTVKVSLGTPPQEFHLVADTGSDSLIVTSCMCVQMGQCPPDDNCFTGGNRSSTFSLNMAGPSTKKKDHSGDVTEEEGPLGVSMTFGSGTVESVIASDVAQVGSVKASMEDALLLMVDRRELMLKGEFEGILGLGPPSLNASLAGPEEMLLIKARTKRRRESPKALKSGSRAHAWQPDMEFKEKLFLEEAGIERFSMCFNDDGPGVLRMNVPEFTKPLPSAGSFHWGLGLNGIKVGSALGNATALTKKHSNGRKAAAFCGPLTAEQKTKGQKTPCGVIPDSGTTLMMGPADQVQALFESLCSGWERCRNREGNKLQANMSDNDAFQVLIEDCGSWMTDEKSLGEIPSIFLNVGAGSKTQDLELTPWSFIVSTVEEEREQQIKYLGGIIPIVIDGKPTGKNRTVCVPSLGAQAYDTTGNGPVWILGTPLFYEFNVGYGLKGEMAFTREPCDTCTGPVSTRVDPMQEWGSSDAAEGAGLGMVQSRTQARRMRNVKGKPRVRSMDTSLPL